MRRNILRLIPTYKGEVHHIHPSLPDHIQRIAGQVLIEIFEELMVGIYDAKAGNEVQEIGSVSADFSS